MTLANICQAEGQRALIGKVCMDRNSPDNYSEETNESLESTERFVRTVLELESDLVKPIITPRWER